MRRHLRLRHVVTAGLLPARTATAPKVTCRSGNPGKSEGNTCRRKGHWQEGRLRHGSGVGAGARSHVGAADGATVVVNDVSADRGTVAIGWAATLRVRRVRFGGVRHRDKAAERHGGLHIMINAGIAPPRPRAHGTRRREPDAADGGKIDELVPRMPQSPATQSSTG
jgi:hypothetical protein